VAAVSLFDTVTPVRGQAAAGKVRCDFVGARKDVMNGDPLMEEKMSWLVHVQRAAEWPVVPSMQKSHSEVEEPIFHESLKRRCLCSVTGLCKKRLVHD
jgi:hypothetical protein